ncbi:hypothetical protein [Kluyvera sp. CHPC 1.251]|uniref:hypothetical protein n=1 Tax=Kluyvera sp. CHPC 1.251 TaxID=2995175 RepID=UPI002FD817A1
MFKKLANLLDIDFDIGNTLILRLWSTFSGGLLVLMIPTFLSASEQGYYFTFSSIIGMQIFFELGFNFVITQMISHKMAHVHLANNRLSGNKKDINDIYHLVSLLLKWYSVISILFFVIVFCIGLYFFEQHGSLPKGEWLMAWLLIVLFSAVNLFLSPFLSVLEGMGLVGKVAQMRLMQSVVGFIILSGLFLMHFRLNSLPAITGCAALFSLVYLFLYYDKILFKPIKEKKEIEQEDKISWRRDILPFQWKIAISWLSGYFIFQLFNPLIFAHQGPVEAGKVGLSLTIFTTILTLSISWVNAKVPLIAQSIARGDKAKVNPLFRKLMLKSVCINILGSLSFIIAVLILKHYHVYITERLVDVKTLCLLLFINIINHIVFCCAAYMRAHKTEPLLYSSLATGVIVGISVYFTSKYSVFYTMLAYLLTLAIVCMPWTLMLFRKFYRHN